MRILLVDDHAILLDGIANLLAKSAHDLLEKTNTIDEALNYFAEAEFDILIADFNLIDEKGLTLIRKVKKIYPNLKIIVLSMHDEAHLAEEILKEGINGYVLKKNSHHDLVEALEAIDKGKVYLSDEINDILSNALKPKGETKLLTPKESKVLNLIAYEYDTEKMAHELGVSEKTIEKHRKSIFKKTKTASLVGLLKFAYANNLI